MRKLFTLLLALALALACCPAGAESIAPWGTPEEAAQAARDLLVLQWRGIYRGQGAGGMYDGHAGYLEIRGTRVFRVADHPDAKRTESAQRNAEKLFGNAAYIVEFTILADYNGSEPFYFAPGLYDIAVLNRDGTVESKNPFRLYTGVTYSNDFSGIIEEVTDFGDRFNAVYRLLEE